ncbi:MAG: alpha/beta hydrolase [Thaumarchaeota archaeon]|nr:alpha/beta hydrolase [Nitrososphaerota archaeon]
MTANLLGFEHLFIRSTGGSKLTLLMLHGTGGDEYDLVPIFKELGVASSMLSPRGKVLENGMPRFFRRTAEGVFDLRDLEFRTRELSDFVGASVSEYRLDAHNVVAIGYSNGANIAASVLLSRPDVLAGAILMRPMLPMTPRSLPDLRSKPVFISAGISDEVIPKESTAQLINVMEKSGADLKIAHQPSGHALVASDILDAKIWLKYHFIEVKAKGVESN